jgi:hypothetical protein
MQPRAHRTGGHVDNARLRGQLAEPHQRRRPSIRLRLTSILSRAERRTDGPRCRLERRPGWGALRSSSRGDTTERSSGLGLGLGLGVWCSLGVARGAIAVVGGIRRRFGRGWRRGCRGGLGRGCGCARRRRWSSRSRCRCRCGSGCGRRGRRRRRRSRPGCRARRQEATGIDVCLGFSHPDAEMHVRLVVFSDAGWPRLRDRISLGDAGTTLDEQRAEVSERRFVPVGRRDGDRETVCRHLPGEGDLAGDGRMNRATVRHSDVDSPVLAACVRVVSERELPEYGPVGGPVPRRGLRGPDPRPDGGSHDGQEELCCRSGQRERQHSVAVGRCQIRLQRGLVERVPRRAEQPGDEIDRLPPPDPGGDKLGDPCEGFLGDLRRLLRERP